MLRNPDPPAEEWYDENNQPEDEDEADEEEHEEEQEEEDDDHEVNNHHPPAPTLPTNNNNNQKKQQKPARKLSHQEQKLADIAEHSEKIFYSSRYSDDVWEYRHVSLPKQLVKYIPHPETLMTEAEWRGLGVRQSQGWEHYMIHAPEPHVLLFRREKDYQIKYPNGKPSHK